MTLADLRRLALALAIAGLVAIVATPAAAQDIPLVSQGADGRLTYTTTATGDRVVDFSHAGFRGGGVALPMPEASLLVSAPDGDAGPTLQAAIDLISERPSDAQGIRGVIQLERGVYRIAGQIRIAAGGVILRGSGPGEDGTTILATGDRRRSVILVEGPAGPDVRPDTAVSVTAARTPVGATDLELQSVAGLSVGQAVLVRRASTAAWIARLGMDQFEGWRPEARLHWQPGSRDIVWERRITAINGTTITLNAPITTALEADVGPATVTPIVGDGRIAMSAVENLRLVSAHDTARPADEDHAWFGISIDRAQDVWVRNVSARGFVSYVVNIGPQAARITVQDVDAADPVSEIGGYRRRVFYSAGQQVLFNRCASTDGSHDFVLGHAAAGPNVFLDCRAENASGDSGPLESWASGALFDRVIVRGGPLRLADRGRDGQGVGWSAANSVLWNCEATDIEAASPPGAYNMAVGCKGVTAGDSIVQARTVQRFSDLGRAEFVPPSSLYQAQLAQRSGSAALAVLAPAVFPPFAADTPRLTPRTVADWSIRQAADEAETHPLTLRDGQFVIDGANAWRKSVGFPWYLGQMAPDLAQATGPAITRFAPGREGRGLTDRLDEVVAGLRQGDVFYHHYGLWYDRRRVDHNYFGSPDQRTGEVWGPLMELPWARSGQGRAWDGLSRYDLTRFNPWFFQRVDDFAALADRKGRVLYYNFYFQHWLLESRSHYVDFPWRPVNALQATGLPNELPAANAFWDVTDPVRRDLHRLYIRHSLDVLKDRTNVVYGIDREYTGPQSFVEFWLDTIAEWEAETGKSVFVALELPKAQTDALLESPRYRGMISAIAIHDWVYQSDGRLAATVGGIDKASREQRTEMATAAAGAGEPAAVAAAIQAFWRPTPEMAYRSWREYADGYPGLVFLFPSDGWPALTTALDAAVPAELRAATRPSTELISSGASAWARSSPQGARLVYSLDGAPVTLAFAARSPTPAQVTWISGDSVVTAPIPRGRRLTLTPPAAFAGKAWVAWLTLEAP